MARGNMHLPAQPVARSPLRLFYENRMQGRTIRLEYMQDRCRKLTAHAVGQCRQDGINRQTGHNQHDGLGCAVWHDRIRTIG